MISLKSEILRLFPVEKLVYKTGDEIASPCPFCEPGKWSGEDRFYFPSKANGAGCRACKRAGRKAWFSFQDIVDLLAPGEIVSEDLLFDAVQDQVDKNEVYPELREDDYVDQLHANVKRDFWYRFGWSDATIDRFKLGYGLMRPFSKKAPRHITPMRLIRDDGEIVEWALEGRLDVGVEIAGEQKNILTAGLKGKRWIWLIQEDPNNNQVFIAEGPKDAISAYHMGFRNVVGVFGSERWDYPLAELLHRIGYRRIIAAGDNDEGGQMFNQVIAGTFQRYSDTVVQALKFKDFPNKADTTNILERHRAAAYDYVMNNLTTPIEPPVAKGLIEDFTQVDPDYVPAKPPPPADLGEYRAQIQTHLRYFLDNYEQIRKNSQAKTGLVDVFAPPPGSGKSYAMVREAERLAKERMALIEEQQRTILTTVVALQNRRLTTTDQEELTEIEEDINALNRKYANLKATHVLYAGPFITGWDDLVQQGIDQSLWFNYEARNKQNCQDYEKVSALANKNYVARAYCTTGCEFKESCLASGYLAQDKQRLNRPITYVRHPNLNTSLVDDYRYFFIDENPLSVFDTPLIVGEAQLVPSFEGWDDRLDLVAVDKLNRLVAGLRRMLADRKELSGQDFLLTLNDVLGGKLSENLDLAAEVVQHYQPATVYSFQNVDELPIRCVPQIYAVIQQEWTFWQDHRGEYNSRLHTSDNGKLIIYPLEVLHIPRTRPIVVADGTALPELYGRLFGRKPIVYAPQVHNPESKTTVLYGSDFTRTTIRSQTGPALADFERWMQTATPTVEDVFGETFNLENIPFDEKMYESTVLQKALNLIKCYADKHADLLVVTYKPIRALLEHRLRHVYPELARKVSFGHYGSLRGTNRYKNVESVLLIGCYRQPYQDLHRRIQAWQWLSDPEFFIPYEILIKQAPYHGHWMGNTYPTLTDPFAQRFVDMVEQGEMQQCLDRIRIHTSAIPKYAYLAMNRPVAQWVNLVRPLNQVIQVNNSKSFGTALKHVQAVYAEHGKFPISRDIQEKFKISHKTYQKIKQEVLKNANGSNPDQLVESGTGGKINAGTTP